MKNNKKTIVLSVIAITTFMLLLIGATYAYFTAQGGDPTSANLNVTTYTTDVFTFTTGSDINIYADQSTFASGKGNATGSTFARATLTANNKTNTATDHYNVYFNISDNHFKYSVNTSTPELLLTIKDANNNEVTSITGLEHKTVTDGKGASISGFDITTKIGLLTLIDNREITASPSKVETWNITITFVNYNRDQSSNMGKSFDGQVLISKDSFSEYTPNTINSVTATKSGSNLTVKLNMDNGTNEIDKYYFAITEKDSIAMLDTKVMRLSNKLAATTPTYVESSSNTYTFASIKDNANYEIYAYAVDKKKIKSNIYKYDLTTDNYSYPTINSVTTTSTNNSITVNVIATKGANNISKYYYSIDNGNTFLESTSNSYTFSNLAKGSDYRIIVKVSDTNNKYSNIYVVNEKISSSVTLAEYVKSLYTGTQGENSIYYHDSSLTNGAGDNSYRYAGGDYVLTEAGKATGATMMVGYDNSVTTALIDFYCNGTKRYVGYGCDTSQTHYYLIKGDTTQYQTYKETLNKAVEKGYLTKDNVKNFVCFGLAASPCPTENLYRIIGVFGNNVKLIKWDYAKSSLLGTDGDFSQEDSYYFSGEQGENPASNSLYYWNSSTQNNTWSESNLNKVNLNTNFINNIGTEWTQKIATTTWKVGGNTLENIISKTPSVAYQNEITNAVTTNTTDNKTEYSAKIGLMYVSDYYYAAGQSAWTLVGYNSDATKDYRFSKGENWLYGGGWDWTISRSADDSDYVFSVGSGGNAAFSSHVVSNNGGVRPSFNLLSSVTYASGSGTSSDPIRIG